MSKRYHNGIKWQYNRIKWYHFGISDITLKLSDIILKLSDITLKFEIDIISEIDSKNERPIKEDETYYTVFINFTHSRHMNKNNTLQYRYQTDDGLVCSCKVLLTVIDNIYIGINILSDSQSQYAPTGNHNPFDTCLATCWFYSYALIVYEY